MKKLLFFASAVALLASCSKDFADDAFAPVAQGENTIYASLDADSQTRAHLSGTAAGWDAGDAIGVFAANEGDATNAYFGYNGTAFTGSLKQVKGEDIFVYSPWSAGKTLEEGKKEIKLSIPATQYYNHDYTTGYGSYVSGMVAAVAQAEDVDKSQPINVVLKPVVSYFAVPIKGVGTVGSVELSIKTGESKTDVVLAGDVTVDLATPNANDKNLDWDTKKKDETFFSITNPTGDGKTITLDCGDGVELNNETKWFTFVIPAYIDLSEGVEFTIKVTDNEGESKETYTREIEKGKLVSTYRNYLLHYDTANITWSQGNSFIIADKTDFLKYAYAATYGTKKADDAQYPWTIPASMVKEDGETLRPAIIVDNLDFTGFNADQLISQVKNDPFLLTVLLKYLEVGGIETIGNATTVVELSGSKVGEAFPTIKGLTVKGTSMFEDGYTDHVNAPCANVVKNLTFENVTVDASDVEGAKAAFILANRVYTQGISFEGVTVKDCKVLPATLKENAAVVGRAFTDQLPVVTNTSTVEADKLADANVLYVHDDFVDFTSDAFKGYKWNTLTVHKNNDGAVLNVADKAAAVAMIESVDLKNPDNRGTWYSVVSGYDAGTPAANNKPAVPASVEMSYWTGFTANAADNGDEFFTAEELAYVVNNGGTATLTNSIDLMGEATLDGNGLPTKAYTGQNWGKVLPTERKTTTVTADEESDFTIGNAVVIPAKAAAATATTPEVKKVIAVTMFGVDAHVSNITVDNAFISDELVGNTTFGISGLSIVGNVSNVTVKNTIVSAYENTTVGGIVRSVRRSNQVENVSFTGRIAQQQKTLTRGTIAGEFAIVPGYTSEKSYEFTGLSATCVGTPATLPVFGVVSVGKPDVSAADKYDVEISFYNFKAVLPDNFKPTADDDEDYVVRVTSFPGTENKGGTSNDYTVTVEED